VKNDDASEREDLRHLTALVRRRRLSFTLSLTRVCLSICPPSVTWVIAGTVARGERSSDPRPSLWGQWRGDLSWPPHHQHHQRDISIAGTERWRRRENNAMPHSIYERIA